MCLLFPSNNVNEKDDRHDDGSCNGDLFQVGTEMGTTYTFDTEGQLTFVCDNRYLKRAVTTQCLKLQEAVFKCTPTGTMIHGGETCDDINIEE